MRWNFPHSGGAVIPWLDLVVLTLAHKSNHNKTKIDFCCAPFPWCLEMSVNVKLYTAELIRWEVCPLSLKTGRIEAG